MGYANLTSLPTRASALVRTTIEEAEAAMTFRSEEQWYVACVAPGRDGHAKRDLLKRGFAIYLPECIDYRTHEDGMVRGSVMPLFPGYLFLRFDLRQTQWRGVGEALFVERLLCRGERPHAVRRGIVERIAAECVAIGGPLPVGDVPRRVWRGLSAEQRPIIARYQGSRRAEDIASMLEATGDDAPIRREYAKDQRLRLVDGPLAGFEGAYIERARGRIVLMLDTSRGAMRVEVPDELIAVP